MTKEELIEFLKENIRIRISTERNYGDNSLKVGLYIINDDPKFGWHGDDCIDYDMISLSELTPIDD